MEKRGEIPPNAAPRESVSAVKERIEALGVNFHEAVKSAGLTRNTGYKLLRGTASLGSLRKVEDWLVREEAKRGPREKSEPDDLAEWAGLGRDLRELDPQRFVAMLEGVREIVAARKREREVLARIFRPTPNYEK